MSLLCFDSKKMMLVDEKGKPFSFEAEGMSSQLMEGVFAVIIDFALPFLGMSNYAGITDWYPISMTFDIITSLTGTLFANSGAGESKRIATLSSGNNTITFSPSSFNSWLRLEILTDSSTSSQPYSIKITNIRLNYK